MNTSSNQFGLIVAYLLPGFIALAGVAPLAPIVSTWLAPLNQSEASLGPPIYAILAATTLGMIVSCFRWILIDRLLWSTGVTPPAWNDDRLEERAVAFNYLVENHYRYFQFYANTLVAGIFAYGVNRFMHTSALLGTVSDLAAIIIGFALFFGSRDALIKYYSRTIRLICELEQKGGITMTNGNDHDHTSASPTQRQPEVKTQAKPQAVPKPKRDRQSMTRSSK